MFATVSDMFRGRPTLLGLDREFSRKQDSTSGAFVTTRWSLILSGAGSGSGDREIREALAELCQIYWRPIFFSSRDVVTRPRTPRT